MNDTLRRMKPTHLRVLYLHWKGFTGTEIADVVGLSPGTVNAVIHSEAAEEILLGFKNSTLDSMRQVDSELQAMAPALLATKMDLALGSTDEKIRTTNCSDLLAMAGHTPVRRLRVEHTTPEHEEFSTLSEEQIREKLLQAARPRPGGNGRAPDGSAIQ